MNNSPVYVIGANMIGYLPESDPYVSGDDLTEALRALADEVMRDWESHEMACGSVASGDDCAECGQYLDAHTAIHNGSTDAYVGHVHYWVVPMDPDLSDIAESEA